MRPATRRLRSMPMCATWRLIYSGSDLIDAGAAPLTDWSKASCGKSFDDLPGIEDTLSHDLTLAEHLDAQLTPAGVTPIERMIGGVLIDQLDDWGYFRGNTLDTARRSAAPKSYVCACADNDAGL